jgi:outer membrane murein-binding lipoprotein Lpp
MTTTPATAAVPPDDALLTQIIARRRRRTPLVTLALAAAVTAGVAFFGGVEIQKHYGTASAASSGNSSFAALASRFAAGRGAATGTGRTGTGGASFFGGGAGGAVIGTVTLIKGNDIYVTDTSGTTTIVHAGSATVTKSVTGSLKSINPGDAVTVVGTQGSNGSTTARSITVGGGNG